MQSAERQDRDEDDDSFGEGASGASGPSASGNGNFECNICLDVARDAVVSMCGHLYCWPCIHQWLETRPSRQTCPVCKAVISRDKLVPLYGRGSNDQSDPRDKVPPRPPGQRTEAPADARSGFENFFGNWGFPTANFEANAGYNPHGGGGAHLGNAANGGGGGNGGFHMSFGVGAFPFGFFSTNFNLGGNGGGAAAQREDDHELLSKMFLVIAFVFIFWMIMV